MKHMNQLPLTVGVTGHIRLREQDRDVLLRTVENELTSLRDAFPHTPLVMLNSLAAGADQLCADAAEELGIPLTAVLPMPPEEYRKDFDEASLEKLNHHLERAERVFIAPPAEKEPMNAGRDFRYRQAGIFVAEHCHALIALWDGKPDGGNGAGTAATVAFALDGDWQPESGMPVRSADNCLVIHVMTPREGETAGDAGSVRRLGNADAWKNLAERTEEFNTLAEEQDPEGAGLLPEDGEKPSAEGQMEDLYRTADSLSLRFARLYRRLLAGLALAGTAVTLAFLVYDEGQMTPMILLCGAALLCAAWLQWQAKRTECHRRFIEYRVLAEALRVQAFLRYAGSRLQVHRLMSWTQQDETTWILCAMCAMNAMPPPEKNRDIHDCWVEGQRSYHQRAGTRTAARERKNERILRIALRISILFYLGTLVYELTVGGALLPPVMTVRDPEFIRTLIKILLGAVSAGTLFMASYYGKMSLGRVTGDHEKMVRFYEKAADRMVRCGQDEQILEVLVREELAENANWSSYQRDNAPELNI